MKRRGFTLIELLVVIAIIAILAAILFPVFSNAKERARQAKCIGNIKQLTQAFRQYVDDYNGVMPSLCASKSIPALEWTGSVRSASTPVDVTRGQIWKYTHNKAIYLCPTDGRMKAAGIYYTQTGSALPAGTRVTDYPFSYTVNQEAGSIYGSTGNNAFLNNFKLEAETAGRSARVLFLIHEARENFGLEKLMADGKGYGINDGYFSWKTKFNDMPSAIHYDGTVCSYADGHAKWISYDQLLKEADYAHANSDPITTNKYSQWLSNSRRAQNTYP